jgi:hypothetical protein
MTSNRRLRQRGRHLDDRDGRPPSPPRPRLSSTGSGGWSRPSAADGDVAATPARRPTYADAATRTPVALLPPLQGTPSLRPRTSLSSLRPLVLPEWHPDWDDDDTKVDDGATDDDSDVGGTEETKEDDSLVVDETAVANRDVHAHTTEDDNPDGSDSPPLLSLPPPLEPVLLRCPRRSAPTCGICGHHSIPG